MRGKNNHEILVIIILLVVLSLVVPVDHPTGNAILGSEVGQSLGEFNITKYYTVSESDFDIWRDGRTLTQAREYYAEYQRKRYESGEISKKEYDIRMANYEDAGWCIFDTGNLKRGFFEDVQCQGSGLSKNNRLCMAHHFRDNPDAKDDSVCKEFDPEFSRGVTRTNTNPTVHRTIAVDFLRGYEGKTFYIYFDEGNEWNGCYKGEDKGEAIKGNRFDLYVGVGKEALEDAEVPEKAQVFEGCTLEEEYKEEGLSDEEIKEIYENEVSERSKKLKQAKKEDYIIGSFNFNPSFVVEENFDLSIFDRITKELEDMSFQCGTVDSKRRCIEDFLGSSKNIAELKIGPQDEYDALLLDITEKVKLCADTLNSSSNCMCNITFRKGDSLKEFYEDMTIKPDISKENIIFNYQDLSYRLPYEEKFEKMLITGVGAMTANRDDITPILTDENYEKDHFYMGIEKIDDKDYLWVSEESRDLPICGVDQKMYVFSTVPKNRLIFYDKKEKKHRIEAPEIKFAFYLKEDLTKPRPVDYEADSVSYSQKKIMLTIKENEEEDIKEYYIFYSKYPFNIGEVDEVLSKDYTGSIRYETILKGRVLNQYERYEPDKEKCNQLIGGEVVSCNLFFKLFKNNQVFEQILTPGVTYYFSQRKEFVKVYDFKDISDSESMFFKIIAKDRSNNILEFGKVPTVKVELMDQIHPSIFFKTPPKIEWKDNKLTFDFTDAEAVNIDGTKVSDLKEYWLYQKLPETPVLNLYNYPISLNASKQIHERNYYQTQPDQEYCYFLLPTDLVLPKTESRYKEMLFEYDYYRQDFDMDYVCIDSSGSVSGEVQTFDENSIPDMQTNYDITEPWIEGDNDQEEIQPTDSDNTEEYDTEVNEGTICDIESLVDVDDSVECTKNNECLVLSEVNEKLKQAQQDASKEGVSLVITSSYRSYEKQKFLYECYQTRLNTGSCPSECYESNCNEAARPNCDSPHTTGGAVDVKLNTDQMSHSDNPSAVEGYKNRELLEKVMCDQGFVRYDNEFWHYEYGTDRWERGQNANTCSIV